MRIIFINSTMQVDTLIILFITQFLCSSSNPQTLHGRMCLTCGFREVDVEIEPIVLYIKPLGVTSTLCLYGYGMLVDIDWLSESVTDVRLLING